MADNNTFTEKQYLDYNGLIEVFKIIQGEYLSKDKVLELTNEEIDDAFCEVYECEEKIELPNNEIWYKTSDNKPVYIYNNEDVSSGSGSYACNWGRSGNELISNEYDPIDDCCKIKFKNELTEIPDGSMSSDDDSSWECGFMYYSTDSWNHEHFLTKYTPYKTVTKIIHFPKTIKKIGLYCFGGTSIENIDFLHENIEEISPYFFGGRFEFANELTIDLSKINSNCIFGSCFLCSYLNCNSLEKINFIGKFPKNTSTTSFIRGYNKLTNLNLSCLSEVEEIGDFFLENCTGLQSIDLSPLSKVTSIGYSFLSLCSGLQTIDLSPLSNVTSIRNGFLNECQNLKTIIIDHPEGLLTYLLEQITVQYNNKDGNIESIYVNDDLLEQYKEAVPQFIDKFKPLSEYKPE